MRLLLSYTVFKLSGFWCLGGGFWPWHKGQTRWCQQGHSQQLQPVPPFPALPITNELSCASYCPCLDILVSQSTAPLTDGATDSPGTQLGTQPRVWAEVAAQRSILHSGRDQGSAVSSQQHFSSVKSPLPSLGCSYSSLSHAPVMPSWPRVHFPAQDLREIKAWVDPNLQVQHFYSATKRKTGIRDAQDSSAVTALSQESLWLQREPW